MEQASFVEIYGLKLAYPNYVLIFSKHTTS